MRILRRKPGYRWVIFGLSFSNMMAEGGITDTVPVIYLAVRNYFHWSATRPRARGRVALQWVRSY